MQRITLLAAITALMAMVLAPSAALAEHNAAHVQREAAVGDDAEAKVASGEWSVAQACQASGFYFEAHGEECMNAPPASASPSPSATSSASASASADPCPDPKYPREAPDGCQASNFSDAKVGSASPSASASATSSATSATPTATASAAASQQYSASSSATSASVLPATGGPNVTEWIGAAVAGTLVLFGGVAFRLWRN